MKKFKCYNCNTVFESEGTLNNYIDAIYGPCSKYNTICPQCGEECGQFASNAALAGNGKDLAPCGNYKNCSCCGG
jgi:hypothetical protein